MAIHERDWYRSDNYSSGGPGAPWSITAGLIAITVGAFLLQLLLTTSTTSYGLPKSLLQEWFELSPDKTVRGQIWRPLTYAFLHDRFNIMHILFNMLFLWWFGRTLETLYGRREILFFYLTSAVLSGLAFLGLSLLIDDPTPAIGASGAVLALMMLYAIHFPRQKIYLFFVLPIEIRWLVLLYFCFDLMPVLQMLALSGGTWDTGIAHAAHLGGLIFGFVYYRKRIYLEGIWDRLASRFRRPRKAPPPAPKPRPQPAPQAYEPRSAQEEEMDRLLEKVFDHGLESLSEKEREFLASMSEEQ